MRPAFRSGIILLILGLTTLVYWNHFDNAFHFDDAHTIQDNLWIRDLKNIPRFFVDATTTSTLPYNQAYRPGVTTLNTIDYTLGGTEEPTPFSFHRSIFISFLLLGLLVYYFFRKVLETTTVDRYADVLALFGMAWFLLHTANAETINYIISRSDSFSTFMILLAFGLYLAFPRLRKFHLYAIPALLGFLVKEPALMFFPLLFVYQLLFEQELSMREWFTQFGRSWKTFLRMGIPFVVALGLFALSRHFTPDLWQPGGPSPIRYLLTQPFVIVHYCYNFILPVNLVVDTDWTLIPSYTDVRLFAGLLFVGALLYIAYRCSTARETRPISFGILWFFIALIPSSSLMPFAEVLNDHRTFFPYIGLFLASITGLKIWLGRLNSTRLRIITAMGLIFLSVHAWGTYQRNEVWHSEESLWKEATIKAKGNTRAWLNYGNILMAQGRFAEARACFEESIRLSPLYLYAYINLAIVKSSTGDLAGADADFKRAIQIDPNIPEGYAFYARFLLAQQRYAEAKPLLEKGLQLSPQHQLLNQLKQQYNRVEVDPGADGWEKDIQGLNTPEAFLDLSLRYYQAGNYSGCIRAAAESLRLKPDYDLAYNNICAAYNRLGQWDKAIAAGEKGLALNPNNELLKGNLAEARAQKR